MVGHQVNAKPLWLSEPILDPLEHILVKFVSNATTFIEEHEFENVICKLAAILSLSQFVIS